MKVRNILAALLLMVAGLQTALAQKVVLHKTNGQTIECDVSELDSITLEKGHEWVDLGLPSGTLWATCNIGANSPEEYGDYFAWGETETKENYDWSTYKYCNGSQYTLTKYCSQSDFGYNSFTDNITELLPEDDAATENWGNEWQMPSFAQFEELISSNYTTTTWTYTPHGYGRKITSRSNGKSIFLPAAGYNIESNLSYAGTDGYYWSRSQWKLTTSLSYNLNFYSGKIYVARYYRCSGMPIRPVRVQKQETYAEKKEKEDKAIQSFLNSDTVIRDADGNVVCNVGQITPISEEQFIDQGFTTDLSKNEYVMFSNSGVYMQIVREGVGEKLEESETASLICRFIEFNILGDSIQLRNDVNAWHNNPDIMKITKNSGSFSANFDTEINGGGAMYLRYGSTSVPSGWLTPFPYIRIGRQESESEGIAKVRLIVPHSEGQTDAASNVYPCFYEITFQKMRD